MPLRLHFLVHLAEYAGRVDDEAGSVPIHRAFVLALADVASFQKLGLAVSEEIDGETELVAEALVRGDVVLAGADHTDAGGVKVGPSGREGLSLDRATRCVILGIEVNHQPPAGEIAELDYLAILIRKGEIRKRFSCLEHDASDPFVPCGL